jgi:hypothetical protein
MWGLPKSGAALALGIVAVGLFAASSARAADKTDKPANQCFYSHQINGFRAPNDKTVYLRVGVNDIYRLDLMSTCEGLRFRESIGINSIPPGDSLICSAIQADVVYRDGGFNERCPVTTLHKLSPAEVAATPKGDLP